MEFDQAEASRFIAIINKRWYQDGCLVFPYFHRRMSSGYKWVIEVDGDIRDNQWTIVWQLKNVNYGIAGWLLDCGAKMGKDTMSAVVTSHNLEAAKWLKNHGCPYDKEELIYSAWIINCEEGILEWIESLD